MQLTRFSDLGLRIVMKLGDQEGNENERMTVGSLASGINASYDHVARVVAKLGALGVVRSVRGRNGGIYLEPAAMQMSVGAVLRQLEGDGEVINCVEPECPYAKKDCLLRHRLAAAREAFFVSLDDLSLGELARDSQAKAPVDLGLPRLTTTPAKD